MNSREFVEDYCDACKYIKFSTSSREYLEERIEQHVAEAVAEQAEKCADAVMQVTNRNHGMFFTSEIREACLDATGESDDDK